MKSYWIGISWAAFSRCLHSWNVLDLVWLLILDLEQYDHDARICENQYPSFLWPRQIRNFYDTSVLSLASCAALLNISVCELRLFFSRHYSNISCLLLFYFRQYSNNKRKAVLLVLLPLRHMFFQKKTLLQPISVNLLFLAVFCTINQPIVFWNWFESSETKK